MTETLSWPSTIKLTQTKPKETQAMNNTIPNLTIIHYTETNEERNRVDDDKHNLYPKLPILNWHNWRWQDYDSK